MEKENIIPAGTKMVLQKFFLGEDVGDMVIAKGELGISSGWNRYYTTKHSATATISIPIKYLKPLMVKKPEDWL